MPGMSASSAATTTTTTPMATLAGSEWRLIRGVAGNKSALAGRSCGVDSLGSARHHDAAAKQPTCFIDLGAPLR